MNKTIANFENPSAFPIVLNQQEYTEGMTLRDYFAAHAPKEVPGWFKPAMPDKPKSMASLFDHFRHNSLMALYDDESGEWVDDAGEVPQQFKDEVARYIESMALNFDQIKDWHREYERQKIFQWPWTYADGMLQSRIVEMRGAACHHD